MEGAGAARMTSVTVQDCSGGFACPAAPDGPGGTEPAPPVRAGLGVALGLAGLPPVFAAIRAGISGQGPWRGWDGGDAQVPGCANLLRAVGSPRFAFQCLF